jgi:ABC-2 type transport system permease protein
MSAVRLFLVAGWRSHRALFRWMRPSAFLPTVIGVPAMQLLWFVHLGRYLDAHPPSYYAVGNALHACAMAGLFAPAMSVTGERSFGTLTAVLATPANRVLMFAGRVVPAVAIGCLTSTVMLGLGALVADLRVPADQAAPLLVCLVVTATSCSAFGLIIGAIGLRTRESTLVANLVLYLMLLLCGVNVPASSLPGWASAIGHLLPTAHSIAAARDVLAGAGGAAGPLAVEAAKAAAYLAVAVAGLRALEHSSRKHAHLEQA